MQLVGTWIMADVPLMESGLTSFGALKFGRYLQGYLSVDVPAVLAFDYPCLSSIASFAVAASRDCDDQTSTSMEASLHAGMVKISAKALYCPVCIQTGNALKEILFVGHVTPRQVPLLRWDSAK